MDYHFKFTITKLIIFQEGQFNPTLKYYAEFYCMLKFRIGHFGHFDDAF